MIIYIYIFSDQVQYYPRENDKSETKDGEVTRILKDGKYEVKPKGGSDKDKIRKFYLLFILDKCIIHCYSFNLLC